MSFNCLMHGLSGDAGHCPRCWEMSNPGRAHNPSSIKNQKRSIPLLELFNQATELAQKLAALQPNPFGADSFYPRPQEFDDDEQLQTAAESTVARLQSMLYNLHTLAVIRETNLILRPMDVDSGKRNE